MGGCQTSFDPKDDFSRNRSLPVFGFIVSFFFFCIPDSLPAQSRLISSKLIHDYSADSLKALWKGNGIPKAVAPIRNGVRVYEIIYWTIWHDSTRIKASGLYYVPKGMEEPLPVVAYHHGTRIRKHRNSGFSGENKICTILAADGYIVTMPDYVGLGKGERFHLYQHAATEVSASIHLLDAVKALEHELDVSRNGQLFATGYSQGGHAAMAFHQYLEAHPHPEYRVTASAPMSGPYDLSGEQSVVMFRPYSDPAYLPYLMYAYDEIYDILPHSTDSAFAAPYDSIIPAVYDGRHSIGFINKLLPKVPKDMVKPGLVAEYVNNPDHPFQRALEENNVYDWKPEAPMLLCYCRDDEKVVQENTLKAYRTMQANGARLVRLKRAGRQFRHTACAPFAFIYAKLWMNTIRNGSTRGRKGSLWKRLVLTLGKWRE